MSVNTIPAMARILDKDGVNLGCKVLPETRDLLRADARRQAKRRGGKGAELRGSAYVVNSLILWYLKLDKSERARIVDQGRAMFDELLAGDEIEPEDHVIVETPKKGLERRAQPPGRRKAGDSDGRMSG